MLGVVRDQLFQWMKDFNISKYHAFVGHSAGALFVKYTMDEHELKSVGDPWLITFNGFDPKHSAGPNQVNFRTTGDRVSGCWGSSLTVTVCSLEYPKNMGVAGSHHLASFDLMGLTFPLMNDDNYWDFGNRSQYGVLLEEDPAFKRCNKRLFKEEQHDLLPHPNPGCVESMENK